MDANQLRWAAQKAWEIAQVLEDNGLSLLAEAQEEIADEIALSATDAEYDEEEQSAEEERTAA